MIQRLTLAWALGLLVLATSCVSKKKYTAATSELSATKTTVDSLRSANSTLQSQLNDAISSNKMLTSERDRYQKESDSANQALKGYQGAVDGRTAGIGNGAGNPRQRRPTHRDGVVVHHVRERVAGNDPLRNAVHDHIILRIAVSR